MKQASRVRTKAKRARKQKASKKQASKCFLEGLKPGGRVGGQGVGLRSVRPYLGPDDRCRGPSLDKLSFVPGLPDLDAGASLYYSFHGFVRLSLFRPRPSASLCLRLRARQLVRDSFRVDCKHSCSQRRRNLESRRNRAQDQEEPFGSVMFATSYPNGQHRGLLFSYLSRELTETEL